MVEQVLKIVAILLVFLLVPRWLWSKKRKTWEEEREKENRAD